MSFAKWKRAVNTEVERLAHLSCDDLIDVDYLEMFESEMDPAEAASVVLEISGYPAELLS